MAYMTDASGVLGALQTELATKNSTSKKTNLKYTLVLNLTLPTILFPPLYFQVN